MILTDGGNVNSKISYVHFLQKFSKALVGKKRQAVAAQIEVFREEARVMFDTYDDDASGVLTRLQLRRMMEDMANGEPVSVAEVSYVLATVDKGFDDKEGIGPDDIGYAIAMWKCMSSQQASIDAKFEEFDADNTGTLSKHQVRQLLTNLNDDVPVSDAEVKWVIEAADIEGDGHLTREEVRPAVALWYINVGPSDLSPNIGPKTLIPWGYSFVLGLACCLLVAATTVLWSEKKTIAWLEASAMGLFWKLFVMDPAKTLCCGTLLEPIFTLLFGAGAEDAALNTAADQIDGALEDAADLGDELGGLMDGAEDVADATADVVADGGGWGQNAGSNQQGGLTGVSQATMFNNMVAFHTYGQQAGKVKYILNKQRARRKSVEHLEQLAEENNKVQSQMVAGRARSSTIYADKVRQKRLKRGLSVGRFVLKAEKEAQNARENFVKDLSDSKEDGSPSGKSKTVNRLRNEAREQTSQHEKSVLQKHALSRSRTEQRLLERRTLKGREKAKDGHLAMQSFRATALDGSTALQPTGRLDDHHSLQFAGRAVEEEEDAVEAFLAGLEEGSGPCTPVDQDTEQHELVPDIHDFLRGLDDSESDTDDKPGGSLPGYLVNK